MASILDLNANYSDSEDDCDYVPPDGELNEESEGEKFSSDDDISTKKAPKRKRRKTRETDSKEEHQNPDKESAPSTEAEKQRAEDIWKSFLSDVGTGKPKQSDSFSSSKLLSKSSVFSCEAISISQSDSGSAVFDGSSNKKSNSVSESSKLNRKKETITEQFEFAGETVTVTKEVDVTDNKSKPKSEITTDDSKDSIKDNLTDVDGNKQAPVANKRKGGLNSVIGTILGKKQKMTTLQKSLHDWNTFKKDEGIEEDLEKYNKGKGGYLERQAFLMRSDHRRFEHEKSMRLSKVRK